MHTGKRNSLQLPEDEQDDRLFTQLCLGIKITLKISSFFSALNSSNSFATID